MSSEDGSRIFFSNEKHTIVSFWPAIFPITSHHNHSKTTVDLPYSLTVSSLSFLAAFPVSMAPSPATGASTAICAPRTPMTALSRRDVSTSLR